jgi:hypothetical protein
VNQWTAILAGAALAVGIIALSAAAYLLGIYAACGSLACS